MRRDYTVDEYLERHRLLAAARPGIAITTDFIVGFPGETDQDFEASLRLLERARFENSFSFVFSPRPHTGAALHLGSAPEWGEVPREVAVERLERLQALQRSIAVATLAAQVGREVEVLVEGPSDDGGHLGRTPENRVVHLESHGRELAPGALVRARVVRSGHSSLGAELGS
jgi:tRNA-2-methylthio-N6-dimethylallyladenosine synthase